MKLRELSAFLLVRNEWAIRFAIRTRRRKISMVRTRSLKGPQFRTVVHRSFLDLAIPYATARAEYFVQRLRNYAAIIAAPSCNAAAAAVSCRAHFIVVRLSRSCESHARPDENSQFPRGVQEETKINFLAGNKFANAELIIIEQNKL